MEIWQTALCMVDLMYYDVRPEVLYRRMQLMHVEIHVQRIVSIMHGHHTLREG